MVDMAVDSIGSIQENHTKYKDYFADSSAQTLSIDSFYELLMAEMTNQDPMEPTSNTEFVSQLASYTSLSVQKNALYYSNANYAASLVGKNVVVASSTGSGLAVDQGTVSAMTFDDENFNVTVNGKSYSLSNIMEVVSGKTTGTISSDGAFATSLIGKNVTVQATDSKGAVVIDQGIVTSLEIKDNEISVIVNDMAYKVGDVIKVENAAETSETAQTEETDAELKELFG